MMHNSNALNMFLPFSSTLFWLLIAFFALLSVAAIRPVASAEQLLAVEARGVPCLAGIVPATVQTCCDEPGNYIA